MTRPYAWFPSFALLIISHPLCAQQVADTKFETRRGFYDLPFDLTITTATPDATIVYTTDGSEPSATNGTIYSGPIEINTTATIRAFAYKDGELPANVDTHTYLFLADVIQQPANIPGYPNNTYWLGGSSSNEAVHDYEMDPAIVNDPVYSGGMIDSMTSIPSMSIVVAPGEIFSNSGFYDGTNVEKKVSVEILYPTKPDDNEQAEAGIESHSHKRMKRSLRLNFRSEYGDSKFDTRLFRDFVINGDSATDRFDRIVLRAGNNRSWARIFSKEKTTYVIDEFARQSQIESSGYGVHGAFVHLYINGLYWGLYNPVERPDRFFQAEYFGGETADWFSLNHGGDLSGNDDRYDYLMGDLTGKDMSVSANYAELQEYLEIDAFLDYLLITWFTGTGDWPQNNWYGGNRNASPLLESAPHRYYLWDAEWSWDLPHGSAQNPPPYNPWVHPDFREDDLPNKGSNKAIANIFNSAKESPEFLKKLSDRVYELFDNDGALTESNNLARWSALTNHVREAVVAESARWGDTLSPTRTRDGDWQNEVNVIAGLMAGRNEKFLTALRNENYYPDLDPPVWNQHGGTIPSGFILTMTNPNTLGTIRYTLDGSDPDIGSPIYVTPIVLTGPTEVKARVIRATEVSAVHQATFLTTEPPALRITEIMYHPLDASPEEVLAGYTNKDDFEFIELRNIGSETIDLEGMTFDDGIGYTFEAFNLAPGEFVLLVSNLSAFEERYGPSAQVLGAYTGNLRNSGESLRLVTSLGQTIHEFRYEDSWYGETDGGGFSLNIADQNSSLPSWSDPDGWFGGHTINGTPGIGEIVSRDLDDLDGDGVVNLLELALGMDRKTKDAHLLPTSEIVGGNLVFTFSKETSYSGIQVEVEASPDLISWNTAPDSLVSLAATIETRSAILAGDTAQFVRVKVSRTAE